MLDQERVQKASDSPAEHQICLGLGSNVNAEWYLREAIARIAGFVAIDAVSTAWESRAVGKIAPDFLNAAVLGHTPLAPEALVAAVKRVEDALERDRTRTDHPLVTIDIDLLLFDGDMIEDDLWREAYRAIPVAELIPQLRSTTTSACLRDVAAALAARTAITPRPEILANILATKFSRPHFSDSMRTRTQ
jgi:2-amino-4-hydroxy-6-hydroxymethyldihydropteridine diphosphokinase